MFDVPPDLEYHQTMRKSCYKARESKDFRLIIGKLYKCAYAVLYSLHKFYKKILASWIPLDKVVKSWVNKIYIYMRELRTSIFFTKESK